MMMKKPLTCRERYVIKAINEEEMFSVSGRRERSSSECRRLLRSRKKSVKGSWDNGKIVYVGKYEFAKEAFYKLKNAIVSGSSFDDISTAHFKFADALKFQGYLQMAVVVAEDRISSLSDAEVRRLLFIESV